MVSSFVLFVCSIPNLAGASSNRFATIHDLDQINPRTALWDPTLHLRLDVVAVLQFAASAMGLIYSAGLKQTKKED
jgi:hypothetical protein